MRGVSKEKERAKRLNIYGLCLVVIYCICSLLYFSGGLSQNVATAEENHTVNFSGISSAESRPLSSIRIIPGGESVGLKLRTKGVLIIGFHSFTSKSGAASPAQKAGLQVGDVITKLNQKNVSDLSQVKEVVNNAGKHGEPITLSLERHHSLIKKSVMPKEDLANHTYQLGIFIRNQASGIGTLTFYDPISGNYGALGHVISSQESQAPISVRDGQLLKSSVTAIERGSEGKPGEKIASFASERHPIGNILKNTPFGVFGKLNKGLSNGIMDKALPIALADQVKEGPAKILTVLDGQKVESFDIQVLSSIPQPYPATKGLVIKITDPRLLRATGGIVQGMSGSPIIQDGKIIGAVTHVFVNDPTSGYGVHIEWMLQEAGIHISKKSADQKKAG